MQLDAVVRHVWRYFMYVDDKEPSLLHWGTKRPNRGALNDNSQCLTRTTGQTVCRIQAQSDLGRVWDGDTGGES